MADATELLDIDVFREAVARYLPNQRWFNGDRHGLADVEIDAVEILNDDWPMLVWAVARGELKSGESTDYQILAGLRPPDAPLDFLESVPTALMGEVSTSRGPAVAYNALHDEELARLLLHRLAPDESATYVRQIGAQVASSVLVYDERLLLRIFRRLPDGPNPDVETVRALAGVGFRHVAAPIAGWRRGDVDLAVLREFVAGGAEGWQLALTSLRDVLDRRVLPADAPGDFGPEAQRLGRVTGGLHVALARAYGEHPADVERWRSRLEARIERLDGRADLDVDALRGLADQVAGLDDLGRAIRVHGDFQMRRVMRTDHGWYLLGFEGERTRTSESAARFTSPLEDIAKMLRSVDLAAWAALGERTDEIDDGLLGIAGAWESHIGRSFLAGYLDNEDVRKLLPAAEEARALVLSLFEMIHALDDLGRELDGELPYPGVAQAAIARVLDRIPT